LKSADELKALEHLSTGERRSSKWREHKFYLQASMVRSG